MAWTIKVKHTRPNTDVEWYFGTSQLRGNGSSLTEKYINTGKRVSFNTSLSENELELIKTIIWQDEAAKNEYWADSMVESWISARNSYNASNNISTVILQNEET